ncbi:MAG: UbiH/UbiF family hydroxylase [Burkholderiales bacterium]|nr:UbiH/UbiF family hydroxylase [Burkholderiales bacterium]
MSDLEVDVAVVGAGLVGASFVRALAGAALKVVLVEPAPPPEAGPQWDSRIYAISPASAAFLEAVGAWAALDRSRVQPVLRMEIRGDAPDAALSFSAYEAGVAELAHIVESGRLQRALWEGLAGQPNVAVHCPARGAVLGIGTDAATLVLDGGTRIRARLVVGADGAASWVRGAARIDAAVQSYGQRGVVANFACERAHRGTAFQFFRPDGVLAYLPLPDRRMSMVWSTPDAHANELLALGPDALCARVAEAGRHALGALELLTPPAAFPLQMLAAERATDRRVALIGDAAHVVHPLAGQGVNLGFGDAHALAEALAGREPFRDCGDPAVLRRYARSRAEAVAAMRTVTDGLHHLFGAKSATISAIRNAGLNFTDRVPVLKTLLVRQALG